jgi:two-component system, chemotaxis family, chemotaxis protein CheY
VDGYGKRILVVDDDEQIRLLLCLVLAQDGYSVHTAAGGEEAFGEMMKRRFDVILTDVEMPRTTGFDILAYCRTATPGLPVVLMSGVTGDLRDPVLEQGASGYLEKPFDTDEVLRALRMACWKTAGERVGVETQW